MKTTSNLFVLIFSVLFAPSLYSQGEIQGKLINEKGESMSFVNTLLLNAKDSTFVKGDISADDGSFIISGIAPGSYLVQLSMMGYQTQYTPPNIIYSNEKIDLKISVMREDAQLLNEIEVTAKKPLFEQKIDRLVVNVQNSIISAGGTALEVLERSPGVIVNQQSGGITLVGKEGVIIMINGKRNYTPVSSLVQLLSGMSADNIEKIELITTPPANFEAEGNAGFINIVLKENANEGFNGGFAVSGGYGDGDISSASTNFNYRKDRFNFFGNYSFSRDARIQQIQFYRSILKDGALVETQTKSHREPAQRNHFMRLGFDYQITDKTALGGLISGYDNKWSMDALNSNQVRTNEVIDTLIEIENDEINQWKHFMGNLSLQHNFNKNTSLNLNADYLYYNGDNPTNYLNSYFNSDGALLYDSQTRSGKITPINLWVGTIDFSKTINDNIKFQAGLKGTLSTFENDVTVEEFISNSWVVDEELTNSSDLDEKIGAAYTSFDIKVDEKTDAKIGLRYEYTSSNLSTVEIPNLVDRKYGNFFPSVFISRKLDDNNNVNFSYSRRITRPGFKEMAPFVYFIDPTTFFAGNPAIQPAISNNFKMDFRHKTVLFSIQYSKEDSSIVRFQNEYDAEKERNLLVSSNLKYLKTASFMIAFPWEITDWWQMQANILGIWQKNVGYVDDELTSISQKNVRISGGQNFQLPSNFSLEISGFYQSKSLWGTVVMKGFGGLNAGIQKTLNGNHGKLSFNVTDILNTYKWKFTQDVPSQNLNYNSEVDFARTTFKLTYTRTFGNSKLKEARNKTTASEDERKRVN
ncbi:MAG: TonB-dependent receptor [Bacteroidetes bacterium]|nr:TonB-dependent receptor [Bacteroidota bacterium]